MMLSLLNEVGTQVAFIEELQRRLTPKELPPAPGASQSVPDLAAAVAAAEQREASQQQQTPFELRALEVVLDVVSEVGTAANVLRATSSASQGLLGSIG